MTTTVSHHSRRRLDVASLLLLLSGLICGVISYWLVTSAGVNALVMAPSIVVATFAATHLTKREASRG